MKSFFLVIFLFFIYDACYGQEIVKGINYDEDKVPDFVLPDPLVCNDGQKVTSVREWEDKRRLEILDLFMTHVYGRTPSEKITVSYTLLSCNPKALDGKATCKQVLFSFTNGEKEIEAILLLYIPNLVKGKAPVFVG